jgi:hypothetical protein
MLQKWVKLKILGHCILASEIQKSLVQPIRFLITQNGLKMRKIWGWNQRGLELFFQTLNPKPSIDQLNLEGSACNYSGTVVN